MPMEFTQAEIQSILSTIDMPEGFYDLEALLESIGEAIDIDALTEAQAVTAFTGAASPAELQAATALAQGHARLIVAELAKAELRSIAKKVRDNIKKGGSFSDLYKELDEIKGLDSGRAATLNNYTESLIENGVAPGDVEKKTRAMHDKLLRDRKKVIAQDQQAKAQATARRDVELKRGAKFKRWITSRDSKVSEMDVANEAEGWIDVNKNFSSGHQTNPSHPRCRCSVVYQTILLPEDTADVAEDVAETAEAQA
jgi:hypothetical protein